MESLLGFKEEPDVDEQRKSSYARKLVPWLNWDEWFFVKHSLFSDSSDSVASALQRISAWRSRGCLPIVIEVTASIIEIQQKDPYYRVDQSNNASLSDEMLAMLYCMAIMRLVNGVVEKTRKKEEVSIAVAAEAIGIPRMLIDVRHGMQWLFPVLLALDYRVVDEKFVCCSDGTQSVVIWLLHILRIPVLPLHIIAIAEGSHRELPALQVVHCASVKALDWLKSYYWEPQSKAIPFQGDGKEKVRKEIKSKLRELALCFKVDQSSQSNGSWLMGKSIKHGELLCGRNKLLTLMAGKGQKSRSKGSKKQITKILKNLVRLYSSYSSEIESVLLDFMLKALSSSEIPDQSEDASAGPTIQSVLAHWKFVIVKFCNKEPELLLNLLKKVLDMIETQEAMKYEEGIPCSRVSDSQAEFCQIQYLSALFAWLIGTLKKFPSAETNMTKRVLLELLRKCLLVSAPGNKCLIKSALHLSQLIDDNSMTEKVKKLSLLSLSNLDIIDDDSSLLMTPQNLFQQEESIQEAAKKLSIVKQRRMKNKTPISMDCDTDKPKTWTLAKSWNPCPIGMLPRVVGSSGCLPVLDSIDNHEKIEVSEKRETWRLSRHGAKRDATLGLQLLDNSAVKKMREEVAVENEMLPMETDKGCLMVDGVWKRVMEEEVLAIKSSVRILV